MTAQIAQLRGFDALDAEQDDELSAVMKIVGHDAPGGAIARTRLTWWLSHPSYTLSNEDALVVKNALPYARLLTF